MAILVLERYSKWNDMRALTTIEQALVQALVNALPAEQKHRVMADVERSQVDDVLGDGSRLLFTIDGYERPPNLGQHTYPVEGTMVDSDGAQLHMMLYADANNRLLELEIIRWDKERLIHPDLTTLETF